MDADDAGEDKSKATEAVARYSPDLLSPANIDLLVWASDIADLLQFPFYKLSSLAVAVTEEEL